MSQIILTAASFNARLAFAYGRWRNDPALQEAAFGYWEPGNWAQPYADGAQEVDVLWPRTNMFGAANVGQGFSGINDFDCMSQRWEFNWPATGIQRPLYVTGQTVDANGNIVANVPVWMFNTGTNTYVSNGTSDANGNYSLPDQQAASTNFVVAFLTGSPDREGTTDDNLTGT